MGIFNSRVGRKLEAASLETNTEALRNSAVLEAVTANVMIVDANNHIVKVNSATLRMLKMAESAIQQELPDFTADKVLGSSLNFFDKNSELQYSQLKSLSSTKTSEIALGGRIFHLVLNPIFGLENERIGTAVEWTDNTDQAALKEHEAELEEQRLKEAFGIARRRAALDSVATNIMVADENNIIVSTNPAMISTLRAAEASIRQTLPSFSVSNVVGSNIDVFHKNPGHQKNVTAMLKSAHKAEINLGNKIFSLNLNPIIYDTGERKGTVVEWVDVTEERLFSKTVDDVIATAINGDLKVRIETGSHGGRNEQVFSRINGLLEMFDNLMGSVTESISAISEGDLTKKMAGNYDGSFAILQEDVNSTIERLVNVVSEIRESAVSVKGGAVEISSGNNNLSQRTEQQAASLEETSAAMEEITTTVQQNASNAVQANTLALGAREAAENGGSVVGDAVSAMQAISESSNKINDIIGVIDEIAFQTNLLALNAAVEAARAGDQGRGFAVVADEVRNLAGRSATAAKEIKELIKDSGDKVQEGSNLVNKSGETLDEIVIAVKKVNDIVAEISTASDEQARGLDEVNKAILDMDEMTQQNAALVEEAAAASESLGTEAEALDEMISFFNIGTNSSNRVAQISVSKPAAKVVAKRTVKPKTAVQGRAQSKIKPKAQPKAQSASAVDEGADWSEF